MKYNKLPIAVFALILPFMLSIACGSSGPPTIGDVVAVKSPDAKSQSIDITTTYKPEDTFYVSVKVINLVAGSTVKVQYKLDGVPYNDATILKADKAESGTYNFQLAPSNSGHVPGSYTAEVYLDNVLVKTIAFTVEGDAQPHIVDVVLAKGVDSENKPNNSITTFNPSDTIKAVVNYQYVKSGSVIKAVLNFAGSDSYNASTTESPLTVDKTGSGTFNFSFVPPSEGFAIGNYTVEVFLDGTPYDKNPLVFTVTQ